MIYGNGNSAPESTVGTQFNEFKYLKEALIEAKKEEYFGQLGSTLNMPKHFGKTVKKYLYVPILDDRNSSDQGLDAAGAAYADGNLYGSSKDIGTINSKLPALGEEGGRVNRVGFTRIELEGSISKFGFFMDYTKESLDFDTDDQLKSHMYREMGRAKGEMNEDKLMVDLYNAAGVVKYAGSATSVATVGASDKVTYNLLREVDKVLTANRAPKDTKIITGSRLVDTKTINKARYAYCGDDVRLVLEDMVDNFGNPAYVPVRQYGSAGTLARGEVGAIGSTRFIEVPEMVFEEGAGANGIDVHPILYVGSGSFTQIGFQTDGKGVKFKVTSKTPEQNASSLDPYGETGFYSIKWYYGLLVERPEWIAKILTAV